MSYTVLAAIAVVLALGIDQLILGTKVTSTRAWWVAYSIILFFQLLTNGWLTGRRIVQYDPNAIIGSGSVSLLGDGRLFFAPVEDLAFGFALVLLTCVVWTRLAPPSRLAP